MKLIVGLGNPGKKYEQTRHNVGFMALDSLAKELGLDWNDHKKSKSLLAKGVDAILLKPQTFMNLSGEAVVAALNFFKLGQEDLIVIHDDLDIELGKIRCTDSSRSAGNNGVQSIIEKLGSQDFRRIRVGIKKPADSPVPAEKYVLEKFTGAELEMINKLLPEIKQKALD